MRHQLDPAIVRITNEVGTAVGLGVLVGSGQVLTCAHVVRDALGLAEMPVDPPATDLMLDFPLAEGDTARIGHVSLWPWELDIAVLVLTVPPPATARPISFVSADDLWGHPFRAFGFPKDRGGGVWAEGVMRGPQTQGWLQIDTGRGGYHVEPGFSGGPVWDDTLEGVIGLVTRSDPKVGVRAAYVIPAPVLIQAWPDLAAISRPPSPYRGLAAFRAADANNFFGRETTTARLLDGVNRKSLLAVVGPSGSGKSSVVFAGLVPALQSDGWLVIDFRPGRAPCTSLAAALLPSLEPTLTEVDRLVETGKLAAALEEGTVVLADVLDRILARANAARVLLIADQFEELYALGDDLPRQHRFLDALLALLADQRSSPFTLCLTLRADFMGQALAYRPFADALQDHDLKLGPMTREELREAIERPAQRLHVTFEPGLVDRILDEVGQEPGNLPLLEFALTLLWERQRLNRLTHEGYQAIGGVSEALAQHAEAVFERLSAAKQDTARAVFVQLVRPGMGTADTRRLATREEVGAKNWGLVQQLAGERLLTTGDEGGHETVELAHEALIQHWERLRTWVAEDRTFREWQERLRIAMGMWQASGQDEGALLRGAPQAEAEAWLAEHGERLPHSERAYIEVGVAAREAQVRAEEARLQKELALARAVAEAERARAEEQQARAEEQVRSSQGLRRRSIVALVVAAVAMLAAAGAIYFWTQAERGRRVAEAQEWAARSLEILERDPDQSLLLAYHAALGTLAEGDPLAGEPYRALHTALTQLGLPLAVLKGHTDWDLSAAFSPDGTRIVTTSNDGTIRLWDSDGLPLVVMDGDFGLLQWAVFSPDGQRVVTSGDDNTARLWDNDGQLLAILEGHSDGVLSAAFSPDGTRIVTVSFDGTAWLWDGDGQPLTILEGHTDWVRSAAFSPDGTRIVTASDDDTARLWDGDGQPLTILEGHTGGVFSAVFSPDGYRIATAGDDNTARLWDSDGRLQTILKVDSGKVLSAAFSPDGTRIVTAGNDGAARLWSGNGQPLAILEGQTDGVLSAVFSPDGTHIVTASDNGTVRLWDDHGQLLTVLEGHTALVRSVAFSPDGTRIVTASDDGTARLWDSDGWLLTILVAHSNGVQSAAFSPDGTRIVTAGGDSTARLWDGEGQPLAVLKGHTADWVRSASFSPDGDKIVTAGDDGTARLWDSNGQSLAALKGHTDWVLSAAFSPNGTRIATTSNDGTIRLWASDGRPLAVLEGHTRWVSSAAFSPDGTRIVTAGDDGTARLWDVSGQPLAVLEGHVGWVETAAFSSDGRRIVTAGYDGIARLWDSDGRPLAVLEGHTGAVVSAAFSADGTRIITASSDGTARIWQTYPTADAMLAEAEQILSHILPYEQCVAELGEALCKPPAELP